MFKKLAADALGLSDIGKVISPEHYGDVDSDDYIFEEEGEKIYFLIKSKSDEYCFTNTALIHLDGTSAMSKKRMLNRYPYKDYNFSGVKLETAGTIDLDIEVKFRMGKLEYSIDVDKKQITQIKDLYKSLYKISSIQRENAAYLTYGNEALEATVETMNRSKGEGVKLNDFSGINEYVFDVKMKNHKEFRQEDFGEIFDKFINN